MTFSKFRFKIYIGDNATISTLELIRWQCELINLGSIYFPRKKGYKYALYMHGTTPLIDHNYYEEISRKFQASQYDKIELFISEFEIKSRIVAYKGNSSAELFDNVFLNYDHILRGSKDLVVYFDYSRLVSKVNLHEEFIPKFNLKTQKDVLVLGNQFGYWGTSLLFSDNGILIYDYIVKFIKSLIDNYSYSRLYFIGGSQGATAALVYGQAFAQISTIYAACPVDIDKKNMLKHLADKTSDKDIHFAKSCFNKTLKSHNVLLYSTVIDHHHEFHNAIADNILYGNYIVCHDPLIDHGSCLRYYIKDIYRLIENG